MIGVDHRVWEREIFIVFDLRLIELRECNELERKLLYTFEKDCLGDNCEWKFLLVILRIVSLIDREMQARPVCSFFPAIIPLSSLLSSSLLHSNNRSSP